MLQFCGAIKMHLHFRKRHFKQAYIRKEEIDLFQFNYIKSMYLEHVELQKDKKRKDLFTKNTKIYSKSQKVKKKKKWGMITEQTLALKVLIPPLS